MLCVENVMTMMVIAANIGTHNNFHELNWSLVVSSFVTNTHNPPTLNNLVPIETQKNTPFIQEFQMS
jgi:hypothetical protein